MILVVCGIYQLTEGQELLKNSPSEMSEETSEDFVDRYLAVLYGPKVATEAIALSTGYLFLCSTKHFRCLDHPLLNSHHHCHHHHNHDQ